MGFSVLGKQCLLPEEALYLMECGSVQVFYQDLPLSIQDGYERFLSPDTVTLQQYQVFGHLKRLGFVVHRFDASSAPSSYARQLNLPQSRDRAGMSLKRKRSNSPSPSSSHTEAQEASPRRSAEAEEGEKHSESQSTSYPATTGAQSTLPSQSRGRPWWPTNPLSAAGHETNKHARGSSSWDNSIIFPDLGSLRRSSSCLSSPDPSLLPGSLTVGGCDLTPWMGRINQREVKMSPNERQRDKRRRRNRDKKVRDCRNWAEYHRLMASRWGRHSGRPWERHRGRPSHLWRKEVAPLHDPTQPISTGELLDKISLIKSTHLLEGASSIKASDQWRISFSVYQPDTVADFKKSNPGKPYVRMCVCSFNGPTPDLRAIKQLTFQSADIPMVFAVVDHGDISFYTCKDFQLPKDVYP
ncbi:tRNA-splicing endonuclease subunit Sen54 isoform X2 [Nerophis ophidion]|nr:tRNA-splicing endonuclease subunit Sen54 isoform X2 [Nerophis ophidion]